MDQDWIMVRLPRSVHEQLAAFCRRFTPKTGHKVRTRVKRTAGELLVKLVHVAPMHVGIAELLRRDAAHRARGNKGKGK